MASSRPLVIAHRGASGYLPEHTREAKVLAYGQGADYLEQDVVATRDGHLVVLHDVYLDVVTDVAARFGGRHRADGRYYVVDFTLDELRGLRVFERRRPGTAERVFPRRFADDGVEFRIVTLEEEIQLIQALNATTGRRVGVYPEIKAPAFHHEHGIDLAAGVLETLARYGYTAADDAAIVQCFDARELARCRFELGTALRLAQLTEEPPDPASIKSASTPATAVAERAGTAATAAAEHAGTAATAAAEHAGAAARLESIARYAQIWAPSYDTLVAAPESAATGDALPQDREKVVDRQRSTPSAPSTARASTAVAAARRAGLDLHPYTFRADALPAGFTGLEQLLSFFYREIGVDAVFCDHPDIAVRARALLDGTS